MARWTRKNRLTGTHVSLYNGEEAGLDTDLDLANWYLCCEDHGTLLSTRTRAMAEHHGTHSVIEWCGECQKQYEGEQRGT